MVFKLPSSEEIIKIAPHLIPKIIIKDNKYWYVKSDPGSVDKEKRDMLGWILGKSMCNIAEVKLLSEEELEEIRPLLGLQRSANVQNTYLVRLAGTYSTNELPCQTLEKAVASELVYSTWIRRRDTHSDNREYNQDGIPIFYDFHIAFLDEPQWAHSTMFLKDAPDYGHPAFWRIKEIPYQMTTIQSRSVSHSTHKAWHYVHSIGEFKKELKLAETSIKGMVIGEVPDALKNTGFNERTSSIIQDFLSKNLITLSTDIEEILKIVLQT